ncbi:hypothetical protein CPB83DRAFT_847063 [Crepidotus variabilis]|uniref:Uncharacterized protein n=1 Tax=Crepidotus variabilis TaxID=179855 RepID=A0A9P6JU55_9AGAR|nr:hypothetical protein CPB83DRAFT_847063 [Crepidotus variabilis]
MFTKFAGVCFAAITVLSSTAGAIPLSSFGLAARGSSPSFNNYGGSSSLSNFDDFFGQGNFANVQFTEEKITVVQEKSIVCHSQSARIIQQRLLILQEIAKKVITEQVCEVEVQTILFEQFHASVSSFGGDLTRKSGRDVGYDSAIASHIGSIIDQNGNVSNNDLGFSGKDLGKAYAVAKGSNWNDNSSPSSVSTAWKAAQSAAKSGKATKSSASSSSAASSSTASAVGGSASSSASSSALAAATTSGAAQATASGGAAESASAAPSAESTASAVTPAY